jgi:predicted nuclease of predicted toxin-antitoxin system
LQKILIDENLNPSLATDAQRKGFLCSHVNHLGKTGTKDWELKRVILEGDWTFVTNNSTDFRGGLRMNQALRASTRMCVCTTGWSASTPHLA